MQLKDLVKPLDQMTEEELMTHLRSVRHRRTIERPATKARADRAEKKVSRGAASSLDKMLNALSPADRAKLLSQLEENNGEGAV